MLTSFWAIYKKISDSRAAVVAGAGVKDLALSATVAPFSRFWGYPWERALILHTTTSNSLSETATRVCPTAKYPILSYLYKGIGPAMGNAVASKTAFTLPALLLDSENNRDQPHIRVGAGLLSGVAQSAVTWKNKAYTLLVHGGVKNPELPFLYNVEFLRAVGLRYVAYMCIANFLTIDGFHTAKDRLATLFPHLNSMQLTFAASGAGLVPAAAILTLPERWMNLMFQRGLLLQYPTMVVQLQEVKLSARAFLMACALRVIWKAKENMVALGVPSMIKQNMLAKNQALTSDVSDQPTVDKSNIPGCKK